MKETHFYFDRNWFVFPFAITWRNDIWELVGKRSRVNIDFLWFHWRWTIKRKE